MNVEVLPLGPFAANCHVVWDNNRNALVIDPGFDGAHVARVIDSSHLKVCGWLLTHGHADHVCGLAEAYRMHPAPVYIHEKDAPWVFSENNGITPFYSAPERPNCELTTFSGTQTLEIGPFQMQAIHTPGHSPGCVCYYFQTESILFSGDTLFKGSAGRTDLRGGDARALAQSLKILAGLPDQTEVFPGHGESSTIAEEKAGNYFLREFSARA